LPTPENQPIDVQISKSPQAPAAPAAIAPVWHTLVLVAIILAVSFHGAAHFPALHRSINRLATYGATAAMEAGMFAWVLWGLHLKKTPLRKLLGTFSWSYKAVAADLGFALVFWVAASIVLGMLSMAWLMIEVAIERWLPATYFAGHASRALTSASLQQQTLRTLELISPANGREIAAWVLLCLLVGFVEEVVFRGYLQAQFTGWARGAVGTGILASAVVFGGAHAYQGVRSMVLLAVFGMLFSLLASYRHSLRAGMFAHSWHDLAMGLMLTLLRSRHLI
jgi:uncharacterized protein